MKPIFSSLNRESLIHELENESFDLLVIGGGITGAGIALDATTRGLKVALIDMQDFAAGTSSRSTKLIHGGLRYLKQGKVAMVREVAQERAIVHANARHTVSPEWMLLPIIAGGTFGRTATSIGLYVYDWLAKVKRNERRKMLTKAETLAKEPLLRNDKLLASGYYVEYRTDDARLTIEIMKEAVARGTKALNYVKAKQFLYEDGKIVGINAQDMNSGKELIIKAYATVNATGPWVDTLRELDKSKIGKQLHLTKGVHIVIDQARFPLRQAIYFDTPDKRMIFAIPRDGKTYIGTTDTDYHGDMEQPRMTMEDSSYLLQASNDMFPTIHLVEEDIESSWVGLRPLIHEDGKSPSQLSRKDEIFISPSRLITIAGGKLSGYRKMSERIVDTVTKHLEERLGRSFPSCTTDKVKLSGGKFDESFSTFIEKWIQRGCDLGLSKERAALLVNRYGSNAPTVLDKIDSHREMADKYGLEIDILASLIYGIEDEMVVRPLDFLSRRTGSVNFDYKNAQRWLKPTFLCMQEIFNWDKKTVDAYMKEAIEVISFAKESI